MPPLALRILLYHSPPHSEPSIERGALFVIVIILVVVVDRKLVRLQGAPVVALLDLVGDRRFISHVTIRHPCVLNALVQHRSVAAIVRDLARLGRDRPISVVHDLVVRIDVGVFTPLVHMALGRDANKPNRLEQRLLVRAAP